MRQLEVVDGLPAELLLVALLPRQRLAGAGGFTHRAIVCGLGCSDGV